MIPSSIQRVHIIRVDVKTVRSPRRSSNCSTRGHCWGYHVWKKTGKPRAHTFVCLLQVALFARTYARASTYWSRVHAAYPATVRWTGGVTQPHSHLCSLNVYAISIFPRSKGKWGAPTVSTNLIFTSFTCFSPCTGQTQAYRYTI